MWQAGKTVEYSDLDIMQMLGRAVGSHTISLHYQTDKRPCTRAGPSLVRLITPLSWSLCGDFASDNEGVAVIMCQQELVPKYQALTQGTRVLESCLHHNLSEHINSEIGLGTITDIESSKNWLRGSFLYQRVRKNPRYYALNSEGDSGSWQERMDEIVTSSIHTLKENQFVEEVGEGESQLVLTDYGEIMSKVRVL